MKCVKEELINDLDEESNTVLRKAAIDLLNIEVDEETMRSNKEIFIGEEAVKEMKKFGLKPSSVQMKWFFEIVKKFHQTAVKFLQKYFNTALKSAALDNMSALSPRKQTDMLTSRKLKSLAKQYSKVVDNIEPFGGMDQLKSEIDQYVMDDEVKDIPRDTSLEAYWLEVGGLTDGDARWQRFSILPRFAIAMAVKHTDTSSVEREFSIMNNIHQNKQRNTMAQDMLDCHLHIRSGVESKQTREQCKKCKEPGASPHCHCTVVEITPEMRQECQNAKAKCKNAQEEASADKAEAKEGNQEKKVKWEKEEMARIEKFKEEVKKRSVFCSPNLFKAVYTNEKVLEKETETRKEKPKEKVSGKETEKSKVKDKKRDAKKQKIS